MSSQKPVDWEYWRRRRRVSLREACTLSLNIDPGIFGDMPSDADWPRGSLAELRKRVSLLDDYRNDLSYFTRNPVDEFDSRSGWVKLSEFAMWAIAMEFEGVPRELKELARPPKTQESP